MSNGTLANYGGRQPNSTAYIKTFFPGTTPSLWKVINYNNNSIEGGYITPASQQIDNLYIPGDLYVDGKIVNPSDIYLKDNIIDIDTDISDNLLLLQPKQFTFKDDSLNEIHYGFIAQEFETIFPELVSVKPDKKMKSIKSINYLEIIPMLVSKIKSMQKEIDTLKETVNKNNL